MLKKLLKIYGVNTMKIEQVEDNWWVLTEDHFIVDGPFESELEARLFIRDQRLIQRGEYHDDTYENQRS